MLNTIEKRLIAHRLINYYKYHSSETGFLEWKEQTPDYIKELENQIFLTQKWDEKTN